MVITLAGLTKQYGDTYALRGVDLEIAPGTLVALLGPNGAGKTTLVEILFGLRKPTSGEVRVLGLDPSCEAVRLKQRLGVQLQATGLPVDLTPVEVLRLYRTFYARTRPLDDVLRQARLEDAAHTRIRNLSGGQRQRLALALALLNDPELLILDEPTAGLDPEARRAIHDVLRVLRAEGKSVLVTSHDLDEVEKLADRVLVLRAGRIAADGSPLALLALSSGASSLWVQVDGALDVAPLAAAGARYDGCDGARLRFVADDPGPVVLALAEQVRARGLTLVDLRLTRPTLEDVYLELVGADADRATREAA
jgi:ABC-2 type transport system ATP-binding protein